MVFNMFKSRLFSLFKRGFVKVVNEIPFLLRVILYFTLSFPLDELSPVQRDIIAS